MRTDRYRLQADVNRALLRLAVRQVRRGAVIVALAAACTSSIVAIQYRIAVEDALDESMIRALVDSPAIRILFGEPLGLDDPGGFTVWRTGTPVQVLVSVWALLAATRITRGEEESGRWDLLLAGRIRAADLIIRYLIVLCGAAFMIGAAVLLGLLAANTAPAGALVHSAGVACTTMLFATIGLLAAQLATSRAAATGSAVAMVGVSLLLRMLADSQDRLHLLAWATPFGLTERSAPYAYNRVTPMVVLAAAIVAVAIAAVVAAMHRDLGGGLLTAPQHRRPRTRLLRSITGFAVRRALRPTLAWGFGIAGYFVVIGTLIASVVGFLAANVRFADMAATAGFPRLGSANGLAAAMFGLLAIPTGLYAACRTATITADESSRRSVILHALPVSRVRLALTDIVVTAAAVVLLLAAAAAALWLGTQFTSTPLRMGPALGGALNTAPVALLALGTATLALGWAPHLVVLAGAIPVAGGFLVTVAARSAHAPTWVSWLSPFDHLAPVPISSVSWTATATQIGLTVVLVWAGLTGHQRRDLIG